MANGSVVDIAVDFAVSDHSVMTLDEAMDLAELQYVLRNLPLPWPEFNKRAAQWFRSEKQIKRLNAWDTYYTPKGKHST